MVYYSDDKRHLICVPYSIENLHAMAKALGIKRCWFHSGDKPHYDIPKKRVKEIMKETNYMPTKQILEIIKQNL